MCHRLTPMPLHALQCRRDTSDAHMQISRRCRCVVCFCTRFAMFFRRIRRIAAKRRQNRCRRLAASRCFFVYLRRFMLPPSPVLLPSD